MASKLLSFKNALALTASLMIGNANAVIEGVATKIDLLVTDGVNYGYCMARITTSLESTHPGCVIDYVSFGCQADPVVGVEKSTALRNWESAQLAFLTGRDVFLVIDSDRTYNEEYCVAISVYNFSTQ